MVVVGPPESYWDSWKRLFRDMRDNFEENDDLRFAASNAFRDGMQVVVAVFCVCFSVLTGFFLTFFFHRHVLPPWPIKYRCGSERGILGRRLVGSQSCGHRCLLGRFE